MHFDINACLEAANRLLGVRSEKVSKKIPLVFNFSRYFIGNF